MTTAIVLLALMVLFVLFLCGGDSRQRGGGARVSETPDEDPREDR